MRNHCEVDKEKDIQYYYAFLLFFAKITDKCVMIKRLSHTARAIAVKYLEVAWAAPGMHK